MVSKNVNKVEGVNTVVNMTVFAEYLRKEVHNEINTGRVETVMLRSRVQRVVKEELSASYTFHF